MLERLGECGMGQVFKARHRKLGRVVALKLIRKERLANPNAVKRFHREIQLAGQLNHPNIVLAFDADQSGPRLTRRPGLTGCGCRCQAHWLTGNGVANGVSAVWLPQTEAEPHGNS
jgi:hypothetical protein